MNRGYLYAFSAYAMWGLLPIYWEKLRHVPALQVVSHRILWSCLFLIPLVLWGGYSGKLRESLRDRKTLVRQSIAAILVCANWLGFIWAVTHDHMVESSLGYFINPLMSVLLGVLLLGERLRRIQWLSIGIAAIGVSWLALRTGHIPWIALMLATTFCLYALVKKTTSLHPIVSLTIETWALVIPALAFLALQHGEGQGAMGQNGLSDAMLIGGGVMTTIPLLLFAAGAQRIPLSAVGLLQYIGPTLQFCLGVFAYHEPFDQNKLLGFGLVWFALFIYAIEGIIAYQRKAGTPAQPTPQPSVAQD
ncbi:MAG: EamA family transporter RarD [Pirellulales bacterium]